MQYYDDWRDMIEKNWEDVCKAIGWALKSNYSCQDHAECMSELSIRWSTNWPSSFKKSGMQHLPVWVSSEARSVVYAWRHKGFQKKLKAHMGVYGVTGMSSFATEQTTDRVCSRVDIGRFQDTLTWWDQHTIRDVWCGYNSLEIAAKRAKELVASGVVDPCTAKGRRRINRLQSKNGPVAILEGIKKEAAKYFDSEYISDGGSVKGVSATTAHPMEPEGFEVPMQ